MYRGIASSQMYVNIKLNPREILIAIDRMYIVTALVFSMTVV